MKPSLYMGIAAFLWSTFPLAIAFGVQSDNFIALFFCGIGVSTALHGIYLYAARVDLWSAIASDRRAVATWALGSGGAITIASVAYYFAMTSGDKVKSAILLEFWPLLSMLIGAAIIRRSGWERMPAYAWYCGFLALAGSVILLLERTPDIQSWYFDPFSTIALVGAVFYGLSGNLQVLLSRFLVVEGEFNTTVVARFLSDGASFLLTIPVLLLWQKSIDIDVNFVVSALYLGAAIYTASAFFFNHALRVAKSPTVNLLFYFAPVFAALWLTAFDYGSLTEFSLLGIALIVVSNLVVSSEYRYAPATVYTSISVLFFALVSVLLEGMNLREHFVYVEISIVTFAIIAGFSLTRLHNARADEAAHRLRIANAGARVAAAARGTENANGSAVVDRLDEILRLMVDYDYAEEREYSYQILDDMYDAEKRLVETLDSVVPESEHGREARQHAHALAEEIDQWVLRKSDKISNGELLAICAVGLIPVFALTVTESPHPFPGAASIFIPSAIVYVFFKIVDLDRGQSGRGFSAIVAAQQMFRRLGLKYYLPEHVLMNRKIPAPPCDYAVRYRVRGPGDHDLWVVEREPLVIRNLDSVLFVGSFVLALAILMADYGLMRVWW